MQPTSKSLHVGYRGVQRLVRVVIRIKMHRLKAKMCITLDGMDEQQDMQMNM